MLTPLLAPNRVRGVPRAWCVSALATAGLAAGCDWHRRAPASPPATYSCTLSNRPAVDGWHRRALATEGADGSFVHLLVASPMTSISTYRNEWQQGSPRGGLALLPLDPTTLVP